MPLKSINPHDAYSIIHRVTFALLKHVNYKVWIVFKIE